MNGIIFLIAILSVLLVLWQFWPRERKPGALSSAYGYADSASSLQTLDPKSLDYKLLAAGVALKPVTFRLFTTGAALAAFALGASFLGGFVGLVLGGIAWFAPQAWLDDKAKGRGNEIEKVLPIAVGRIAARAKSDEPTDESKRGPSACPEAADGPRPQRSVSA